MTQYPTAGTGDLAYIENSQGFPWLPGPILGTFYSKGVYLYNGAFWDSSVDEIAAQLEQNINDITSLQVTLLNHVTDLNNPHQTSDVNLDFSDVTTNNASTSQHGFLPKLSGIATQYLNGVGSWTTPSGGGGSEPIIVTNAAPTPTDDINAGYFVGQRWIDTSVSPRSVYICRDNSAGAAQWEFLNSPPFFRYETIKVVQTLSDFPAPVGNEILLDDNTIYFIDNPKLDIGANTLVFNQRSQINGFGQNVSGISSSVSGTVGNPKVFFKSGTNLFMNDLEIFCEGTNQLIWQHIGNGTVTEGESFELNRFNILCELPAGHNNQLGYISGIRQGFIGTFSCFNFENGFICADAWTGGFRVDNTIFINCSGVFFGSDPLNPVSFARRMSSNANITVPLGSIGYDFPETAFSFSGQYQLQNGNASGPGIYVSDFTSGFPAFNPIGNFKNNTGIQDTFPGGEWINNADTITTITATNVWTPLNIVTINKSLTWFDEINGVFEYLSETPLDISISLTLTLTGKANDIVDVKLVKESASLVQTDILSRRITIVGIIVQGRAESVPIITTDQLVFGDKILVQIRNTSGTSNVTTLIGSNCVINAK